jgi:hypothetical protein
VVSREDGEAEISLVVRLDPVDAGRFQKAEQAEDEW